MKLKSNFLSDLDFKPLNLWPDTVPAVALDQLLLCGFHLKPDHPVFEHSFKSPAQAQELLKSLYPQLSLSELARLALSPVFKSYFDLETLFKAYGFHFTPDLEEVLEVLVSCPTAFQNFVSLKKVGPQELVPLTGLKQDYLAFACLEVLKAQNTKSESKQDSVKRLELLSDLLQMGQNINDLQNLSLLELTQKRFPVTTKRDERLKDTSLPWLSQIKSQFKRRGDKAGFEVQFFAGTPAELNKMAQNLTKVAEAWNTKP